MRKVNWAIIIPTLNEEKYIGRLLDSLARQTMLPKEIVIVDAESTDQTMAVIQSRKKLLPNIRTFQISRSTLSRHRNYRARQTFTPDILFLDADVQFVTPHTLVQYVAEVKEKRPDMAVTENLPLPKSLLDKLFFALKFKLFRSLKPIYQIIPSGMCLYIRRDIFNKVEGFNEKIPLAEDREFAHRIVSSGGDFKFLNHPKFFTSVRRLDKEGRLNYLAKMVYMYLYIMLFGYNHIPIKYEFGNYS